MGTYTTNYQLYMPTVGETGWGTLVNTNFSTIDTTIKSLSNRITAVENEVNGNLNCTSVTTSGKITGNGGIVGTTGTFSGAVTAASLTLPCANSGLIKIIDYSEQINKTSDSTTTTVYNPNFGSIKLTGNLKFTLTCKTYNSSSTATITIKSGSTVIKTGTYAGSSTSTFYSGNISVLQPIAVTSSTTGTGYATINVTMEGYI